MYTLAGAMKPDKSSDGSWIIAEDDNGPYLVGLSTERKVRNLFELQKGKFFRTDTIAEILDIEPEVIRDLIRRRQLPAIRIGKSYRVSEGDLQEFLNERYTRNRKEKIDPNGEFQKWEAYSP